MQIFEFHFNPPHQNKFGTGQAKTKDDLIFDSFCFEPENVYEKRLGSLYMLGFLKNVLPQNVRFLDNLAKTIKERYYKTISATPEKSLKETLKKANESLEKIAKGGDVSWLGNLSFGVISLTPHQKPWWGVELNFTKVGDLKFFLIRKGQLIDIDQKLKFEDIEPYPLKIFGNIVCGKLTENDIVLVLTQEVADSFLKEKVLNEFIKLSLSDSLADDFKKLKGILNGKKEELSKISGICLLIALTKEALIREKEILSQRRTLKIFSFKPVFVPFLRIFRLPKISLKPKIPQIKFKLPKLKELPWLKSGIKNKIFSLNKKIALILALIFFLALGFFIFEKKEEKQLKTYQEKVNQIQEKVNQADSFLILKNSPQAEKKAKALLEESWQEISPLVNIASTFPPAFSNQVLTLKNNISENLYKINKLIKIAEPELVFEFQPKEFIPQKIVSFQENLYFFSPYSENIFEVNQNGETKVLSIDKKFSSAVALTDSVLFFGKPDKLIKLKDNLFQTSILLEPSYPGFNFNELSSYKSNLYFLDKENGKIIKYPYLGNFQWGEPQLWIENKNIADFKSMAVDGSLWALTKENVIERYYAGKLQETLELKIFPSPKVFSKIFVSPQLPYLYILEPNQNRIVILNKSGQIVKQFQSEKFDNLLDFSVFENGMEIWILNSQKIYKIEI